jgi:hypothetical protein
MNLYHAVLLAAQMRRNARRIEEAVGREKRRESFLSSVPREAGDTLPVQDLADFQDPIA